MGRGSRHRWIAVALAAGVLVVGSGVEAFAQVWPFPAQPSPQEPPPETTTTTSPPPETTTTTTDPLTEVLAPDQPSGGEQPTTTAPPPADPASGAPAEEGEGDGGHDPVASAGRDIPAEARAVIDSIARTGPGDNTVLVGGAAQLEAAGVARDEAVRAVFGRFPVLGPTRWSDDWYFPRWTGTRFRYHQGLDMFAPYGTPVAAPVDGVADIGSNALGGLTVKVVEPDGTYWYLAHLSGIAEGLVDGQQVTVGQVVGFVGTSGNAVGTPPHLHFGYYPQGASAAPPKPLVDSWVADGAARLPELLAQAGGVVANATTAAVGTALRATGTTVGPPTASAPSRSELLWASAANPAGGAVHVADAAAAAAADRLDWSRRAAQQQAMDLAWAAAVERANRLLAPLANPFLLPR